MLRWYNEKGVYNLMNTFELLEELEKRNIEIYLKDGDIKLRGEEEKLTPDLINLVKEYKQELITFITERARNDDMKEWRKYARWFWEGVLDEAERQENIKRMKYAQDVLKTIKRGN